MVSVGYLTGAVIRFGQDEWLSFAVDLVMAIFLAWLAYRDAGRLTRRDIELCSPKVVNFEAPTIVELYAETKRRAMQQPMYRVSGTWYLNEKDPPRRWQPWNPAHWVVRWRQYRYEKENFG